MPKIDLTGRINGDFIVLREIEPVNDKNGKKKARWVCECQTCHEKEVILGESICRNRHKLCSSCLTFSNRESDVEQTVAKINKTAVAAGYKPMTSRQFVNACKFVRGHLAPEDENDLPDFIDYFIEATC